MHVAHENGSDLCALGGYVVRKRKYLDPQAYDEMAEVYENRVAKPPALCDLAGSSINVVESPK